MALGRGVLNNYNDLIMFVTVVFAIASATTNIESKPGTVQYLEGNGYPSETHSLQTGDGYLLTIFRIPHSPQLPAITRAIETRPAVLLLHGFVLTSDAWVLPHPRNGLAYLLADAGFDVWLGNQRGNTYARKHIFLSADDEAFWNFSWHEIGYYDLAAMFDYIRAYTGVQNLHYVGYSQGTSALLVLLSSRPEYRANVKSIHLLAPMVYMQRMQQPLIRWGAQMLHYLMVLVKYWGNREIFHFTSTPFYAQVCQLLCADSSILQPSCYKLFDFIGGLGSQQTNESLLIDICETHPAGASTKQILHFLQVYSSGDFRNFDYGATENVRYYNQTAPPNYDIASIGNCMHLYYSDNDYFSAPEDVIHLSEILPCAELHRICHADWNHYDFIWSKTMKEALNERIVTSIRDIE